MKILITGLLVLCAVLWGYTNFHYEEVMKVDLSTSGKMVDHISYSYHFPLTIVKTTCTDMPGPFFNVVNPKVMVYKCP